MGHAGRLFTDGYVCRIVLEAPNDVPATEKEADVYRKRTIPAAAGDLPSGHSSQARAARANLFGVPPLPGCPDQPGEGVGVLRC